MYEPISMPSHFPDCPSSALSSIPYSESFCNCHIIPRIRHCGTETGVSITIAASDAATEQNQAGRIQVELSTVMKCGVEQKEGRKSQDGPTDKDETRRAGEPLPRDEVTPAANSDRSRARDTRTGNACLGEGQRKFVGCWKRGVT